MLGKGLESLIPNKSPSGGDGVQPIHTPATPSGALPQGEDYKELAPAPHEEALPSADVHAGEPMSTPAIAATPEPEPLQSTPTVAGAKPTPKYSEAIFHIELDKIKPNPQQPRRNFDEAAIRELAASIREFGVLQPIVVTKIEREVPTGTEVEYELIAGERRLLASKMLGLERIPVIIKKVERDRERLEMAIIENLQRENLNAIEMARAFSRLQDDFRLTQREIASRLGRSRESVANTMRLLNLPPAIQKAIEENHMTESHGRLLLALDDPASQQKIFNDFLGKNLTTRELKERVRAAISGKRSRDGVNPELKTIQDHLSAKLKAPVKISSHGDSGTITISFYSEEELRAITDQLGIQDDTGGYMS